MREQRSPKGQDKYTPLKNQLDELLEASLHQVACEVVVRLSLHADIQVACDQSRFVIIDQCLEVVDQVR